MSTSSHNGRVVRYGKRSSLKHHPSPSPNPERCPKRQKLQDDHDQETMSKVNTPGNDVSRKHNQDMRHVSPDHSQRTARGTYGSRLLNANDSTSDDTTRNGVGAVDTPLPLYTGPGPLVGTRPNTPIRSRSPSPASNSRLVRTSSTKPKDLSSIFAPLPQLPEPPSRSPGKSIAKRMLVRSHTEPSSPSPSVSSSSTRKSVTAAASLPIIAPASSQPERQPPSPPSPSPILSRPNFRTYSQTRSFLVALPATSASHLSEDDLRLRLPQDAILEPDDGLRESYTDLRTRWGVDNSEDDPYHTSGINNELMSITELRSKGESRRFLDEVGYLFEGLEAHGMTAGVKRSSAVEIVLKMCDAEFVRKAKAADFIGRAWHAMRHAGAGDGDNVLDPCLAFFVALVARDRRDVDDLARKDDFFDVMVQLLGTERERDGLLPLDDADARRLGFAKAVRVTLSNLRSIIVHKSDLFTSMSHPSTRVLASYALSSLTPSLPSKLLAPVVQSVLADLALVPPLIDTYASGLDPFSLKTQDEPDLEHIDYCLRILDVFLLGVWGRPLGRDQMDEKRGPLSAGLIAVCVAAAVLGSDSKRKSLARQCIESSLRVLINLTHFSAQWCSRLLVDPFTLPAVVCEILSLSNLANVKREDDAVEDEDSVEADACVLDRQCLALALLTNIVLGVDEAKDLIRETHLDPSCPRGRHCIRSCRCPGRGNAIESLASLFVKTVPKPASPSAPELDFFRCHLAALLCLLTAGSPANQRIVWQTLPGMGTRDRMDGLSHSVHQFLEFYAAEGEPRSVSDRSDVEERIVRALEVLHTQHHVLPPVK